MNQIISSSQFLRFLLFICLCSHALSVNLKSGESCARICSGKESIFKYEENNIYVYNFRSIQTLKNPNVENEDLTMALTGKAKLSKVSACDFSLSLTEVDLTQSISGKGAKLDKGFPMMKKMLEKYNLRFGFDDGRIVGVCPNNKDAEFAVNVKKAILSSLQVSLDSLDTPNYLTETDISGDCITEYSTKPEPPNFVVVKKTKSISGCARKNKYFSTITGRVFEQPMENRNFALLDGSYECDIKIKRSEGLKESICKEVQSFKPFSSRKTGSSVKILQELKFDSIQSGKIASEVPTTRLDLVMNHGDEKPLFMKIRLPQAMEIAKQLCTVMQSNTCSATRTKLFVKLIQSLTLENYQAIQNTYKYFNENSACSQNREKIKSLFLDALPHVKTNDAYKFLIEDAKIYQFHKLGLNFIENSSPSIIALFSTKLDEPKIDNSALLTLSGMIKTFCQKTPGCMLNPDIIKAMNKLVNNLGTNCNSNSPLFNDKILFSLRAIGNAGDFPGYKDLVNILQSCVILASNSEHVKAYALEAVRQFPCHAEIDTFLWTIYDDISHSSEVRIQAYLSLIRCPLRETFRKVIQRLNTENSQQLGSFVWSHITNLIETSDRFKTELRDMLQIFTKPLNDMSKRFNLDFRSYSKNIEKTFQKGLSSAKVDANIIFSSSPFPSSFTTNVTLDVFGRSVNILEFGYRGNAFDVFLNRMIRPTPHKNPHPSVVKMDKKHSEKSSSAHAMMYTKIMGREVFFTPNIINDITMSVMRRTEKESYEKSILLLDAIVSFSSITGFPVEIEIQSALSAEWGLARNKFIKLNDIEIDLKNHVAIQIIGKLQVNGHCTKIGVRSTATASSDAEFGGKLKLIKDKPKDALVFTDYIFEISKIPDNSKLLSFSNEMKLIHELQRLEPKPDYKPMIDKCTGSNLLELRGIQLCALVASSQKYDTYFSNVKAELNLKKFNGFKFQLTKEYQMKPFFKWTKILVATSFQGGESDTFKFQYDQDLSKKLKSVELVLWKKDIHVKLGIDKNKISGQLKYGDNEATLTGTMSFRSLVSSNVNVQIKSKNDVTDLKFLQRFTQEGIIISFNAQSQNDKSFGLESKTTVKVSKHRMFNFFQRFRHETKLKFTGENVWFLKLQSSQANKPTKELSAEVDTYWQTRSVNNFAIKQKYIWSKYSVQNSYVVSEKIPGVNYTIFLEQQIEVKEKKFHLKHDLNFYLSKEKSFSNPFLVALKLKTFDMLKNEVRRHIKWVLFLDIVTPGKGKVLLNHYLNLPVVNYQRDLQVMTTWKKSTLDSYDIDGQISEGQKMKIVFKHKFTSTQNGISLIEFKMGQLFYTIKSELMLPNSHVLTISLPDKSLVIKSKVDTKSVFPFSSVIKHDIEYNKQLIAALVNTVEYNSDSRRFSFNSIGNRDNKKIYSLTVGGQLKHNFTPTKISYDFATKFELKFPGKNIDVKINNKQFANIILDGKLTGNGKNFESTFVYKNNDNKMVYGYETISEMKKDGHEFCNVNTKIYTGATTKTVSAKFGKTDRKFLLGLSVDSGQGVNFDVLYKVNYEKGRITTSSKLLLVHKNNKQLNVYYQNNVQILFEPRTRFSMSWNGKFGKDKEYTSLKPFGGSLKFIVNKEKSWEMVLDIPNPLYLKLSNVHFGFLLELDRSLDYKLKATGNILVKWQKLESRTANYYELKTDYTSEQITSNLMDSNIGVVLTQDSSNNKLFQLNGGYKSKKNYFLSTIKFVSPKENAAITLLYDSINTKNRKYAFSISTSNEALKTFSVSTNIKKQQSTLLIEKSFILLSKSFYNIEITQIRKYNMALGLDIVVDVKWDSNVPYLNSGSYGFGILVVSNENYQLKFNLNYKGVKKLYIKLSADLKSNEIQAYAESFFVNPLKFSLHVAMVSANSFTFESECGYKDDFFKIQNGKLTWKQEPTLYTEDLTFTFVSSNKDFTDIKLTATAECDPTNLWTTLKASRLIEYKGKEIHKFIIDLKKKQVNLDSSLGGYVRDSKIRRLVLDLKYDVQSFREMSFEYSISAEPLFEKSKMEFVYFRKAEGGKTKAFGSLGEAVYYKRINFESKNYFYKEVTFINKDVTNGLFDIDFNLPTIKPRKLSLNWDFKKESSTVFSGVGTYQDIKYKFRHETFGILKKSLEIKRISGKDVPKEILLSYDFEKDYIFRFNVDEVVDLNVNLKAESENKHSGVASLKLLNKKRFDSKVKTEIILPKDTKTIWDFLKALFGIKKGLHLKYKIIGEGVESKIERNVELYHLESKQFPGGTKSFFDSYTKVQSTNTIVHKYSLGFDYGSSMFDVSQKIYVKIDDKVIQDIKGHVKYISRNDFLVSTEMDLPGQYESTIILIYNKDVVQTQFYINLPSKPFVVGFGFRNLKKTNDLSLNFVNSINKVNYTIETNMGNLFYNLTGAKYFPVGKEYFIDVFKKYEIRVSRKQDKEYDLFVNYGKEEPIKLNVLIIYDTVKDSYGFRIKGTSGFERLKHYSWKLNIVGHGKGPELKITSSININKKLISDLTLRTQMFPIFTIKIDHKGTHKVNGVLTFDREKSLYKHLLTVKERTYKTELWSSQSTCGVQQNINCVLVHTTKVRKIIIGVDWETNYRRLELTWNKQKKQSLILTRRISDKSRSLLFENPIKVILLTHTYPTLNKVTNGIINLEIKDVDKSPSAENITFTLKYKMKGSLKSDYKLELKFQTSLLKKGITLAIKRDVSLDIGDLYVLDVKATFDDEKSPFFGVKGFLRQLSPRSYNMQLHFTNYDKFAILSTTAIFASEECSLEYKLEQSNLPTKEFLVQYVPYRKFHITNNKDFKILISRVLYQYGYRGDYVIKLGSQGANIVAFSTYNTSPWKYYAEVTSEDQKTVVHVREIGNTLIGELYRKTSNKKILDASLKINIDEKNVLISKTYWDPKLFDRTKTQLLSILKPENLQGLMNRAYENSENQFSTFISNMKKDVIKNLKVSESLEFAKGIANEWEKFPKNFITSYDDDDYYMKTMMTSITSGLAKFEIGSRAQELLLSTFEAKRDLLRSLYDFVVNAKFYSLIYKPLENTLNSFTYEDVKQGIVQLVDTGKKAFSLFENVVNKIANILEKIGEKARATAKVYKTIKETLEHFYKSSMVKKLFDMISDISNDVLNSLEKLLKTNIIKQRLQYYKEAIENSQLLINFVRYSKAKILEYFKSSNLISFISETMTLIRTLKYKEAFINFVKLEETKFDMDLEKASIDFQFYVMPLPSTYLRMMKSLFNLIRMKDVLRSPKTKLGEKLLELFYRYEYLMFNYGKLDLETIKKLLPPFDRSAWVLNGNMIVTFDGNAVKIGPGECSYVLARDFKKKSFTLVMNIKSKNNEKEFRLDYFKTVTILQDGSIKVDGTTVDVLPKLFTENGKTLMIYRDDDITKIKTSEDLLIKYFHKLDSLKVKVSGHWHGAVRGLLGSNDFDSINDLATPSGLITHDAGVLSKSWSLDKCEGQTKTGLYSIRVDEKYLQQCVKLLHPDSLSYLKRCHSLINPNPYFELCHRSLQYSIKDDSTFKDLLCTLSRNYVMRCKARGLMIRLDKTCVKCGNKKLSSLISETEISNRKKFNIILIMEQSKLLLPYKELIKSIVGTLGYESQNIFTLMTYNGKGVFNDVYFRSVNQKINNNKGDFMKLIDEFWSEEQMSLDISQQSTTHPGKAIFDAIKMSSTPGYVEKIILIGSSPCAEHKNYIFSLLAGLMDKAGISLTYLTNQEFTGTDVGSDTVGLGDNKMFTFDQTVLTSMPWNRRVQAPKDACSSLARLEQGFVWSLAPLLKSGSAMKMRRVAERIQLEMDSVKGSIKQKCYCEAGKYDDGKVECKVPKSRRSSLLF